MKLLKYFEKFEIKEKNKNKFEKMKLKYFKEDT